MYEGAHVWCVYMYDHHSHTCMHARTHAPLLGHVRRHFGLHASELENFGGNLHRAHPLAKQVIHLDDLLPDRVPRHALPERKNGIGCEYIYMLVHGW